MPLPTDPAAWMTALSVRHDSEMNQLVRYNNEYELKAPRAYMHPDLLRELDDRVQQVVIAWPQLVVGAVEERLDVEGFRLPDEESDDAELWRVWQANGCDEESQMAHVDALACRRSYMCVGSNENDADTPLVTFESPLQMYADINPRDRKVRAAMRRWTDYEDSLVRLPEWYSTLYLPDMTVQYEYGGSGWVELDRDVHNLGQVPVVPIINRGRLANRLGKSEFDAILPLTDAANKIATDMMVAAEFVALPMRLLFGIGPDEFEDEKGNKLTPFEAMMGRVATIPRSPDEVKAFEFAAAQLDNFTKVLDKLAELVGSIAGLPGHYMGKATDNPPSADAIRANEIRLIKRAERRQRSFGGSYETGARLIRRIQTGDWDPRYLQLETRWRDAATPTFAQKADAATKLHAEGVITTRQLREDLGYTSGQIARMEADDEKDAQRQAQLFKLPSAADQMRPPVQPPVPGQPALPPAPPVIEHAAG